MKNSTCDKGEFMVVIKGIFEVVIKGESQQKIYQISEAHLDLVLVIFV